MKVQRYPAVWPRHWRLELCAIPKREGWGENYRSAENLGKLHYYRPSNGAG